MLPYFEPGQLNFFKVAAKHIELNKTDILENLVEKCSEIYDPEEMSTSVYLTLISSFEILIDDFVLHMSKQDVEGYLYANLNLAMRLSAVDVPLDEYILAYSLYEVCYTKVFTDKNLWTSKHCETLDKLNHHTLSRIARRYAEIEAYVPVMLNKMIESADTETRCHIDRVSKYCEELGIALGYNNVECKNLIYASSFHDCGLYLTPEYILKKIGELTSDEFSEIRKHPYAGAESIEREILERFMLLEGKFKDSYNCTLYHHAKFNGKGYPDTSGKDIPMVARIVKLADVYDRLRSERPYRKKLDHRSACNVLFSGDERGSPEDFDKNVLNAFAQREHRFEEISRSFE